VSVDAASAKDATRTSLEAALGEIRAVSHAIHADPETAFEEHHAASLLAAPFKSTASTSTRVWASFHRLLGAPWPWRPGAGDLR